MQPNVKESDQEVKNGKELEMDLVESLKQVTITHIALDPFVARPSVQRKYRVSDHMNIKFRDYVNILTSYSQNNPNLAN
jgi:hypothetical protein